MPNPIVPANPIESINAVNAGLLSDAAYTAVGTLATLSGSVAAWQH